MRLNRNLLVSAALMAVLGGCHSSDSSTPTPQPPAPLPTGSATTTVTTGTTNTVTVAGTTVTLPPATTTALTTLASGNVTVTVSQNDTTKQDAAGLAAMPTPSGATTTAVWTWDAAKATTGVDESSAAVQAADQMISISFIVANPMRLYVGQVKLSNVWVPVLPSKSGNVITFTFPASVLPLKFQGKEYWTTTSGN